MHSQVLYQDYSEVKEFNYFFCSDLHFGSKGQDIQALEKDFKKARERNCKIFINGDVFDLILSGDRKRYSPSSDKYNSDNNINLHINEAFDFLSPYADLIVLIGTGNHCTAVQKFHQMDVIQQLIWSLNTKHNTNIKHGQYSGFVLLRYHWGENGQVRTRKIYYNHGQGGAAEVTKGTIGISRHMLTKNADIYHFGHVHQKVLLPSEYVLDVDKNGNIISKERAAFITGAYMKVFSQYDANKKGYELNYGEEKMRSLQGVGGIFMKHTLDSDGTIYQEFTI